MMKLLILLLPLVFATYRNLQRCTDEVNAIRSRYVEGSSEANMNELVYNRKLEKKILKKLKSSGGCPEKSVEYEDMFIFGLSVKNSSGLLFHVAWNAGSMEIACVETRCGSNVEVTTRAAATTRAASGGSLVFGGFGIPGYRCSDTQIADYNGMCRAEE